jgi:MFS family permease
MTTTVAGDPPAAATQPPALWVIAGVTVTGILANTLVNAPLPDILADFERPDSDAGLFVAAAAVPGVFTAIALGFLADRFGRRAVLVPCLAVFGVTGIAGAFAPSYEVLLALRFVQGMVAAGLVNLAVVLIGDHWSGVERARILGYNAAVLTGSLAVSLALGGFLTELGGWRASFAPYALGVVVAIVVARNLPAHRPVSPTPLRAQLTDAGAILRTPLLLGAMLWGFVAFTLIFGLFLTVLPLHLEDEFGLSAGARGLIIAAPALGSTATSLQLGRLRRANGARRLITMGAGLFALGFLGIGLAPSVAVLVLAAVAYGIGEGMSIPTVQDLVTSSAPQATRGAVVAVFVSAIRSGQAAGPLLAGVLLAATTPGAIFLWGALAAALLAGGIGLLAGRARYVPAV